VTLPPNTQIVHIRPFRLVVAPNDNLARVVAFHDKATTMIAGTVIMTATNTADNASFILVLLLKSCCRYNWALSLITIRHQASLVINVTNAMLAVITILNVIEDFLCNHVMAQIHSWAMRSGNAISRGLGSVTLLVGVMRYLGAAKDAV